MGSKSKIEELIKNIEEYSGNLRKNKQFSSTLRTTKEKLQSVSKLMKFPKSQNEFDIILEILRNEDTRNEDYMLTGIPFDRSSFKKMSFEMDSSILNSSLLDISHNPLKAEESCLNITQTVDGVTEIAMLENMKNINLIFKERDVDPREDFIESFVSVLLESPIIKKRTKVLRFNSELKELETCLRKFVMCESPRKKLESAYVNEIYREAKQVESFELDSDHEPVFARNLSKSSFVKETKENFVKSSRKMGREDLDKSVLEVRDFVVEVKQEEGDDDDKEKSKEREVDPLNRAFITEPDEELIESSNGEISEKDLMESPTKNILISSDIMKDEDTFDSYQRKFTQLKKKFKHCKNLVNTPQQKESPSRVKESIDDLVSHFVSFTLNDGLNLQDHVSKFLDKIPKENTKGTNVNAVTKVVQNMKKISERIQERYSKVSEGDSKPEFDNISMITPSLSRRDRRAGNLSFMSSRNNSAKRLLKDFDSLPKFDPKRKVFLTNESLINFSKNQVQSDSKIEIHSPRKNSRHSSEDTEFQKETPRKNLKLEKVKEEKKRTLFNFFSNQPTDRRVEKMASNLYNSAILKEERHKSSIEEITEDALDYTKILSNSMFLEDKNYRSRVNPLNESLATITNPNPSSMRIYNYFWTPRYLRTGVSSFPFDNPVDTDELDNAGEIQE